MKCADCGWSLAFGMNKQSKKPYGHYHCSNVDIATGHNAGLPALGAVWGFRGADELRAAGADELVYQPGDILTYIHRANAVQPG